MIKKYHLENVIIKTEIILSYHEVDEIHRVFVEIDKLVIVHTTAAPVMQSAALFLFANYHSRYRNF